MVDDVLLNKAATIERCLQRIAEEHQGSAHELESNQTRQDAIILNLQRACEAAIDAAMHVVRLKRLGLPQESREAFRLLEDARMLSSELSQQMQAMVGFRNIAMHEYQKLNLDIVRAILTERLDDFQAFAKLMVKLAQTIETEK
jgi:uncharacterized protein YutE (UPF0331/DUF86 family)